MRYFPKAILRSRDRPLLIWLAPLFLVVAACFSIAFWVLAVISEIASDAVTRYRIASLLVATVLLLGGALVNVLAAVGFFRQRVWARALSTFGSLILLGVAVIATMFMPRAEPGFSVEIGWSSIVFVTAQLWYFYRHKPVRDYYTRLGRAPR